MTRVESEVFTFNQDHHPGNASGQPDGPIGRTQLLTERATLSFLLTSIYHRLFNRLLRIQHSLADGYFFTDSQEEPITEEMIQQIDAALKAIFDSDKEIKLGYSRRSDLIATFVKEGLKDKVSLLKTWSDELIPVISCGEYIDIVLEPMSTDKKRLCICALQSYSKGVILRFPKILTPTSINEWSDPDVFYEMFREYREWAQLIGCDTVGKLNEMIYQRKIDDIKWVAEGLHSAKLAKIGKKLVKSNKRVVTVAGPSSSNKTTFAKRLAIQLRVNGCKSVVVEMDDFYKNRVDIPFGENGEQDFESIDALNIPILTEKVRALLNGESVHRRRFDFKDGVGIEMDEQFSLGPKDFLIIEGIHGLNPILLDSIGRDNVCPIYVSALTPMHLDDNHRFPTSDLRLIRRIVRDYNFRGYSPRETIRRWTSVRLGEERNIFPYQGNAEFFFNSSMVYELAILSVDGKALLAEATVPSPNEDPDSPVAKDITREARRLLGLLNFFYPASKEIVPHISCIREFIGGSDLKY